MGIRFRRSMKLGKGIRLNLSKGGPGLSFGGKNAKIGVGPRGMYRSASIPGTGIYAIDYMNNQKQSSKGKTKDGEAQEQQVDPLPMPEQLKGFNYPAVLFVLTLISLPLNPIISIICLGGAIYGRKKLQKSPRGKGRAKFKNGKNAILQGDTETAMAEFNELLETFELRELYSLVGELNFKHGNYDQARNYLEKHLNNNASDLVAQYMYGLVLKQQEEYEEAISTFQNLLGELSEDHELRTNVISQIGELFLRKGEPATALEILKSGPVRARKLDDDKMKFKYLLGVAYKEMGENDRAKTHLQRVYAHDTEYLNVAELLEELEAE